MESWSIQGKKTTLHRESPTVGIRARSLCSGQVHLFFFLCNGRRLLCSQIIHDVDSVRIFNCIHAISYTLFVESLSQSSVLTLDCSLFFSKHVAFGKKTSEDRHTQTEREREESNEATAGAGGRELGWDEDGYSRDDSRGRRIGMKTIENDRKNR
jgi:hypothetical protein